MWLQLLLTLKIKVNARWDVNYVARFVLRYRVHVIECLG